MYAIAHVRGGGDLGEYWHQEGMLLNKRNTFTDFITCAEYLIKARSRFQVLGSRANENCAGWSRPQFPNL